MFQKIIDYWKYSVKRPEKGKIELDIKVTVNENISFRVDADRMEVDWGDGEQDGSFYVTAQLTHLYKGGGNYHIIITGVNLTAIDMPSCHCIALEVKECNTLEFINCCHNYLSQLNVEHCKELYELYCSYNQLTELNLRKSTKLFNLACTSNQLIHIDVKGCHELVNLYCCQNQLRTLDLSHCRKLVVVKAGENAFDEKGLLDFISTLKQKFLGKIGMINIKGGLSVHTQEVSRYIHQRGWCEI